MSEQSFVMVPTEITLDMQHAYFRVIDKNMDRVQTDCTFGRYRSQQEAWKEMLKAAPECESDKEIIKNLTAKLGLISIAADEGNLAKVKELIPPSCADVVREMQEESSRDFLGWLVDEIPEGKKVWPYEIQNKWIEYLHTQLRNPEQEK